MSSILMFFAPLFLSLVLSSTVSLPVGSRLILRAINTDSGSGPDAAIDLNATTFDAVLRETPASHAIVEFFAHWCPACRNYKPQYEKVARLFNGADAVHPGSLLMARVDCALKINSNICDRFSVGHYPMLLWGPPSKFVSGGWEPNKNESEILLIDDVRTADRLLTWINKQMGSSYRLNDLKFENDHLQINASDPGQIARAVYDVEEATSTALDIIINHKLVKSETRASLLKFLQILVTHHPSRRCRMGGAEILVNFDELWPSNVWLDNKQESVIGNGQPAMGNLQICGKEVPRGYWIFCRGSKKETRGFSCGLWVLLHSLSVRVDDGESQMAFTAICDFVHNFFVCEECRQHFYEMCSSVTSPINKTRDFVLWLWTAHNSVNKRLMEEETLEIGDPKFPKVIWPPKQLCPNCYAAENEKNKEDSQSWDYDEVFNFLVGYYGKMLVSLYKEKGVKYGGSDESLVDDLTTSTNAVVVPVGAALAIAVASCAFGALACFWRSRQKNRKIRRSWN